MADRNAASTSLSLFGASATLVALVALIARARRRASLSLSHEERERGARVLESPAQARKARVTLVPWTSLKESAGIVDAMLGMFADGSIAETTLRIPHPYTAEDAQWWLANAGTPAADFSEGNWAIFEGDQLVGGIGLEAIADPARSHVRLLGYYVKSDARGRGIASRAVATLLSSINNHKVARYEASIFAGNVRSARVLEKSGFTYEGRAKNYYSKNGALREAVLYAKVINI